MANPDILAKTAREKLAQALSALQTTPDTPDVLLELAGPIAQAMGILHKIERSQGRDLTGKEAVLDHVRTTLNALQVADVSHPALDSVMEHVAGSLASVHQLARATAVAAPQPAAPPQAAAAPQPAAQPAAPPVAHPQAAAQPVGRAQAVAQIAAGIQAAAPARAPQQTMPIAQPQPAPQPQMAPQPQPAPQPQFHHAHPPAQAHQAAAQPAPQPQAAQRPAAAAAPQTAQKNTVRMDGGAVMAAAAAITAQPARPMPGAGPSQPGGLVNVELGAHSPSNFYKGLGGNDVIEHGGIFAATYKIPKLGAQVNLRILLPGDYEFQASGVVQWIREPNASDVEPGFGARLTQITPEGRQLVYRYTRNREPMFYDDL